MRIESPSSAARRSSHLPRESEAGFTLVEVAVVALLLAFLGALVYGSLSGIMRTKASLERDRVITRTAQYVLERMTRELTNRVPVAIVKDEDESSLASASGGEGADEEEEEPTGEETAEEEDPGEFQPLMVGKDQRAGDRDIDTLRFVSAGSGQVVFSGRQNVGVVEVFYELRDAEGTAGDMGKSVLVREEQPAGEMDSKLRSQRRVVFPLSKFVSSLNFRYRKRGKWLDEWPERREDLPDVVEITIRVEDERGNGELFRTAVSLLREARRNDPDGE